MYHEKKIDQYNKGLIFDIGTSLNMSIMKKCFFYFFIFCFSLSFAQNYNISELGVFPYDDMEGDTKLSDVWGYVDADENEYAIVGLINGTSILDVTDPANIVEVTRIPGPSSIWRDMKTWGDVAYVVHDSYFFGESQGLLMIDLSTLNEDSVVWDTYNLNDSLDRAHNIYIDENGVAYLFGSNYGGGGALMLDVTTPMSPTKLGAFTEYYLHDGYARGDTLWGSAIYLGSLLAIDVVNKVEPEIVGDILTPNTFTHNCWPSDDHQFVFTSDEVSDGSFAAYDVSDAGNIQFMDKIQSSISDHTIPHNTHVYGDFLVNSYYTDGLQIVNMSRKDNLIEIGRYDTSPSYDGDGFNGAWGAYPYLESENILVSDREEGLYVLEPQYKDAVYLEGTVVDADDLSEISGVKIGLSYSVDETNSDGEYKTGTIDTGVFDITYTKYGYQILEDTVHLQSGITNIKNIELVPWPLNLTEDFLKEVRVTNKLGSSAVFISWPSVLQEDIKMNMTDVTGKLIYTERLREGEQNFEIKTMGLTGLYIVSFSNENGSLRHAAKVVLQ